MTSFLCHRVACGAVACLLAALVMSTQCGLHGVEDGTTAPPDATDPYTGSPLTTVGVGSVGANANNGSPLRYWMDPYLRNWAYANNGPGWVRNYPDLKQFKTTLRIGGQSGPQICGVHQSNTQFRFIRNSGPISSASNGQQVLSSVVTTDNGGIRITHSVTYQPGEYRIRHDWKVENLTSVPYSGVALRFGGECNLGGADASAGGWDSNSKYLYCARNDSGGSGRMGLQEISGATFDGVIEGDATSINNSLIGVADLPDPSQLTSDTFLDYLDPNLDKSFTPLIDPNSMAVEWRPGSLDPGTPFQAYLYERWIPSSSIQVVGPSSVSGYPGNSKTVYFQVTNMLNADTQSVTLTATPPTNWSVNSVISPISIGPSNFSVVPISLNSSTIGVTITVPNNATAGTYYLSLDASGEIVNSAQSLARAATIMNSSGSDRVAIKVSANPTATVTAPAIPLSTGSRVIYTAISPSTSEGINSVIAALSINPSTVTRAFAWNSTSQSYIEVPRSMRDIKTYTGIFIATREPLRYSLNGASTSAPFELKLHPKGWTFAGIPPITEDNVKVITTFAWPYTNSETSNSQIAISYDPSLEFTPWAYESMGTVSSEDNTTSRPWFWNGSAYVQADELVAGRAYWFKNNLDTEITLTAGSSGNRALALMSAVRSNTVTTASATTVAHDIGQPPAMPSGSESSLEQSSGGKCGVGSGVAGFLLLTISALLGLRLRRVERP